jgi:hypothetical protein
VSTPRGGRRPAVRARGAVREKHGDDVQIERTRPFNEFEALDDEVREAARAYEERDRPPLPYEAFAAETEHPSPERMRNTDLSP